MLSNIVCEQINSETVIATSRVWLIAGDASTTFPVKAGSSLMVGSFQDTLVRIDNEWLIQSRKGGIELKYSYE